MYQNPTPIHNRVKLLKRQREKERGDRGRERENLEAVKEDIKEAPSKDIPRSAGILQIEIGEAGR